MRDPKVDVYSYLINFIGTSREVKVYIDLTKLVSAYRDRTRADRI